jgi:hypothetical protein
MKGAVGWSLGGGVGGRGVMGLAVPVHMPEDGLNSLSGGGGS